MGNCCCKGPRKAANQNVGELEVQHFLEPNAMSPPAEIVKVAGKQEATITQVHAKTEGVKSGSAIGSEPEKSKIETSKLNNGTKEHSVKNPLNEVSANHAVNPIATTSPDAEVRISYAAMLLRDSKSAPQNLDAKVPTSPVGIHQSNRYSPVLPMVKPNVASSPVSHQQKALSQIASSPASTYIGRTGSPAMQHNGIAGNRTPVLTKPPQIKVIQPSKEQSLSEATLVKSPSKSVRSPSKPSNSPQKSIISSSKNVKSPVKAVKAENYVNENQQMDQDAKAEERKLPNKESKRKKKKKKSKADGRKPAHAI